MRAGGADNAAQFTRHGCLEGGKHAWDRAEKDQINRHRFRRWRDSPRRGRAGAMKRTAPWRPPGTAMPGQCVAVAPTGSERCRWLAGEIPELCWTDSATKQNSPGKPLEAPLSAPGDAAVKVENSDAAAMETATHSSRARRPRVPRFSCRQENIIGILYRVSQAGCVVPCSCSCSCSNSFPAEVTGTHFDHVKLSVCQIR